MEGKKKTAGERKGENAEQVTCTQQLQTVKEKHNKAKQKPQDGSGPWQHPTHSTSQDQAVSHALRSHSRDTQGCSNLLSEH